MSNRIYFTILLISGILFLVLISILSFHNRPAADDFYYVGCVSESGIWNCMKDLYMNYSGRWSAYLLTGFIISIYNKLSPALFIFCILSVSALIIILNNIIKTIFDNITETNLPRNLILVFTLILTSALFFTSFSKGETWFWIVQVCTYLWSIMAFLAIINLLIKNKIKWYYFVILFISGSFIGGSSESYSLIFIFLLITLLITLNSSEYLKIFFKNKKATNSKLIFSIFIIMGSFFITMLAPGNEVRLNALPQTPVIERLIIPFESYLRLIIFKIIPILPFLLIFCSPWIILGDRFSLNKKEKFNFPLKPFLYLAVLLFIFVLPTSIIMSELGPDRALSIVSFSLVFFFSTWFYYIGSNFNIKPKYLNLLKFISVPAIFFIILFQVFNQFNLVSAYADAYDKRINYLKNFKTESTLVEISPFPQSGMLYSAEISKDPDHFTNKFLVSAHNLNYKVKRSDEP